MESSATVSRVTRNGRSGQIRRSGQVRRTGRTGRVARASGWAVAAAVLAAIFAAGPAASAAAPFIPFTRVPDVCPECPRPELDRLELTDGRVVLGVIHRENPFFYLVERRRELRAVPRELVKAVTRSEVERPRAAEHVDQILLTSGLVFSGRITHEHANGTYELAEARSRFVHRVHPSVVSRVFKAGRQVVPPP